MYSFPDRDYYDSDEEYQQAVDAYMDYMQDREDRLVAERIEKANL